MSEEGLDGRRGGETVEGDEEVRQISGDDGEDSEGGGR